METPGVKFLLETVVDGADDGGGVAFAVAGEDVGFVEREVFVMGT